MKVLITGIAGLLGSKLANHLNKSRDFEVYGIDDLSGGYTSNVDKNLHEKCYWYDLKDDEALKFVFDAVRPDIVYHFAAYAAECLSPFIRKFNYENNLVTTANVVNNCIRTGVKRLVFTSSLAVYGEGTGGLFDEKDVCVPKDPYGVAKLACEQDIRIAGEQHGLDWCVLRPHNIYGPNQNIWDKYRNVLGIWMYQKLEGKPITIYGDGSQTRAFTYVDDIMDALCLAGASKKSSKEIINLGGTVPYSINQLAEIMQEIVGGCPIERLEKRHEVKHAITTHQKSVDIFGYANKTPLREGIINMWEWAQKQPPRAQVAWKEYELDQGIYSYWKNN